MLSAGGGIARRLLTSVSIIGRDNEPIYLLGDDYLWDRCCSSCDTDRSASSSPSSTKTTTAAVAAKMMTTPSHHDDDDDEGKTMEIRDDGDGIDDDPFGFFETNFSNPRHRHQQQQQQQQQQQRMSLIQQLVLHASLDVFEEKISCTSSSSSARTTLSVGSKSGRDSGIGGGGGGGVRWRTPGTDSATSMYVGLLCRVEERWSVYGELLFCYFPFSSFLQMHMYRRAHFSLFLLKIILLNWYKIYWNRLSDKYRDQIPRNGRR